MSRTRHVELIRGRHDAEGRRLCCHCAAPLSGRRVDWCSDDCALRYRIRKGEQGAARTWLWCRQRGVCQLCGVDTVTDREREAARKAGYDVDDPLVLDRMRPFGAWDADHTIPLVEGGSTEPDNLRTLCKPCHKAETAQLRGRMAASRQESTP